MIWELVTIKTDDYQRLLTFSYPNRQCYRDTASVIDNRAILLSWIRCGYVDVDDEVDDKVNGEIDGVDVKKFVHEA